MKPLTLPSTKNNRISYILNAVFGVIMGLLLFRMFIGKMPVEPSVYIRSVWVILFPVILLRHQENPIIYIASYVILWGYIAWRRIAVHKQFWINTILRTALWMVLIAIPFVLVGFDFFSLFEYRLRYSYLMQRIPFVLLFFVILFSNRYYFKQKFIKAFVWANTITGMTIILLSLAHILPLLITLRDLNFASFQIAFVNDVITKAPVIALFIFIIIGVCSLLVIERQFIYQKKTHNYWEIVLALVFFVATIIVFSFILNGDYYIYKPIASGKSTCIDWNQYPNRQFIWLDPGRIGITHASVTMFYPYGNFELTDTLQVHAADLGQMKIIEGVNVYKLQRILEILVNGPRDSVMYVSLQNIIDGKYEMPRLLHEITQNIRERYGNNKGEITVTGWVTHNGKPLSDIDFCVNKWVRSVPEHFERVWKAKTDMTGKFEFNCFKGKSPYLFNFHMYFLPSDIVIGYGVEYIKITNLPPLFKDPGNYILDTIKIETKSKPEDQSRWTINIYPRSPMDSFEIWLPAINESLGVNVTAEILQSGKINIENIDMHYYDYRIFNKDKATNKLMKQVRKWRFFTSSENKKIEIYINSNRYPLL